MTIFWGICMRGYLRKRDCLGEIQIKRKGNKEVNKSYPIIREQNKKIMDYR